MASGSIKKRRTGMAAGLISMLLIICVPVLSRASSVGLILPKDCAFSSEVKDKFSSLLREGGIKGADVLMQRPGSDKVSRLNSMRKFLAYGVDVIVIWGGTSIRRSLVRQGKHP